jgi:hypothetical protein
VRAQPRPDLAALVTVARFTGWRKAELVSRQWRHVDFTAGWVRLEPEETKNREGRQEFSVTNRLLYQLSYVGPGSSRNTAPGSIKQPGLAHLDRTRGTAREERSDLPARGRGPIVNG